jgi:hypothetical protein
MNDPVGEWRHGGGSVGTTAQVLTQIGYSAHHGVMVCADADNDGVIYIGSTDKVTADRSATGGIELRAGSTKSFPIDDPSLLFVIGSAPGQGYSFGAF